jgi:hypothetical protein
VGMTVCQGFEWHRRSSARLRLSLQASRLHRMHPSLNWQRQCGPDICSDGAPPPHGPEADEYLRDEYFVPGRRGTVRICACSTTESELANVVPLPGSSPTDP